MRVSQAGGEAVSLTALDRTRQELGHAFPQFLPDGRHFLYFVSSTIAENTGVYIATLDRSERRMLVHTMAQAVMNNG